MARLTPSVGKVDRGGMPRLIDRQLATARNDHAGDSAESLVADRTGERHALRRKLGHGRFDVIAHQIQLMAGSLGWMDAELRRGQREDQPTATGVDRPKPQDIAEELPDTLRIRREDQTVHTNNHRATSVAASCDARVTPSRPVADATVPDVKKLARSRTRRTGSWSDLAGLVGVLLRLAGGRFARLVGRILIAAAMPEALAGVLGSLLGSRFAGLVRRVLVGFEGSSRRGPRRARRT